MISKSKRDIGDVQSLWSCVTILNQNFRWLKLVGLCLQLLQLLCCVDGWGNSHLCVGLNGERLSVLNTIADLLK